METVIKMNRSSRIVLTTRIRKRFKTSRFDLKREVMLVLLALTIFASWLCLASAALPDNNSSIGIGNYIVENSDNKIAYSLICVMVGALIGYLFSLRRLEKETAIEFLHERYLPLLGTLDWIVRSWYIWTDESTKEKVDLSDEETTRILSDDLLELSQIIESTIKSGALILIHRINNEAYKNAMSLDYLLRDYKYKILQTNTDNHNSSEDVIDAINKVTPSIENLYNELEKVTMPMLIKEYRKIMEDDTSIFGRSNLGGDMN